MKKTGLLILTFMLFLVFSACSGPDGNIGFEQDKDTLIVTSFYRVYITGNIAANIEGVKVVNMTEPQTGCLHDYQLVPADLKFWRKRIFSSSTEPVWNRF